MAHAGDCPDFEELGATAETAESRLSEAEALYPQIRDRFSEMRDMERWVVDGVSCQTAPVTPELAARYHRFRAISSDPLGGLRGESGAQASASVGATKRLGLSQDLGLPEGHALRGIDPVPPATAAAPSPTDGMLYFDGVAGTCRPSSTATFFQRTNAEGETVDSVYLFPGDPLPAYPRSEPVAMGVGSARPPLRVAAVTVGAGALAALAGNLIVRNQAVNGSGATLDTARVKLPLVNGLAASALTLGVTSAGLLTATFVVK